VRSILTIFVFCTLFIYTKAQQNSLCQISTEGTEFWFGFIEGELYTDSTYFFETGNGYGYDGTRRAKIDHTLEITVTAREGTYFRITIGPDEVPYEGSFYVAGNSSIDVEIPWELVEPQKSEVVKDMGIHLVSDKPVNVYSISRGGNNGEVSVIYPIEALGKEYFAMCYDIDISPKTPFNGSESEFLIVATQDFTTVKITPSKLTDKLNPKDSTFIVILNRGQVYQVQTGTSFKTRREGMGDLTGSHVISNKPIAFFSGSRNVSIPADKWCCANHLFEQIPCVQSWGKEYHAIPLKSGSKARYRIMAARDATTVTITGEPPVKLNRGEFVEMLIENDQPRRIFGNKPIMVAQFNQSRSLDVTYVGLMFQGGYYKDGYGDPFMLILNSSAQLINNVTFLAYDAYHTTKYCVNIVTLTEDTANIVLDGNNLQRKFKTILPDKYSYAQIDISSGIHQIKNLNEDGGFVAYVYSYGELVPSSVSGFPTNTIKLSFISQPFIVATSTLYFPGFVTSIIAMLSPVFHV